ncbi:MAG: aldo/keto reductase [Synechococcus sp.]|nr:aldo/keto reductase [Synechococcus sp.]
MKTDNVLNLHLGTLNFDYPYTSAAQSICPKAILDAYLKRLGGKPALIDTAYYYGNARTERLLGELLQDHPRASYRVCSKANPWFENDFETGKLGMLSEAGITHQLTTSLKNLQLDTLDTYLLHAYDYETPLATTLEACDTLYRKERFNAFGVSNFSLQQLEDVIEICEHLTLHPSVYQGMYNIMCRKVEPVIQRMHDIKGGSFVAYNPLAGGLLTGRYRDRAAALNTPSRFSGNRIYQNIFWKEPLLNFCDALENPLSDALQWLAHHSKLDPQCGDGIVIGASSSTQLDATLTALTNAPTLKPFWVDKYDQLYKQIEGHTPNYCF